MSKAGGYEQLLRQLGKAIMVRFAIGVIIGLTIGGTIIVVWGETQ